MVLPSKTKNFLLSGFFFSENYLFSDYIETNHFSFFFKLKKRFSIFLKNENLNISVASLTMNAIDSFFFSILW